MRVAALVLVLLPLWAQAEPRQCLVVGVTDGDTITARCGQPGAYEQVKARLAGIDAPERRQAFGARAKEALSDLTFQQWADLDCRKTDRYGRGVCTVSVDSRDVGLAMVSQGMAWWYRAYQREQTPEARVLYEAAEQRALVERRGLWRDGDAMAPWEWRAERRK